METTNGKNVQCPLQFLLYTSDLPIILENTLVRCADESTMLAEVPEPGKRVPAVLSLYRDLIRVGDWRKRWGMLVNLTKFKDLIISMSRTLTPLFPNLLLDGTVVERATELKFLWCRFG